MIHLSVNVNKVATLRNSRGGDVPSVIEATAVCVDAGTPGITVHPRADERHIRAADVREIAAFLSRVPGVELNVEGDPRPDLLALVHEVRPAQCTLVPVQPGELTSQAGWPSSTSLDGFGRTVRELRDAGVRVSVFVDPVDEAIRWAGAAGADRVELYTAPFAQAFARGRHEAQRCFAEYVHAAELAHALGLGINAGHDLDLDNLVLFRRLPQLAEVSIGHALISRALFAGLGPTVKEYLALLSAAGD